MSLRTLQYYDEIGLLPPTEYTEAGYRLYDDTALEQQIKLLTMKKEHFYHCSKEILKGLGQMYVCDGEFKSNIDKVGGG